MDKTVTLNSKRQVSMDELYRATYEDITVKAPYRRPFDGTHTKGDIYAYPVCDLTTGEFQRWVPCVCGSVGNECIVEQSGWVVSFDKLFYVTQAELDVLRAENAATEAMLRRGEEQVAYLNKLEAEAERIS